MKIYGLIDNVKWPLLEKIYRKHLKILLKPHLDRQIIQKIFEFCIGSDKTNLVNIQLVSKRQFEDKLIYLATYYNHLHLNNLSEIIKFIDDLDKYGKPLQDAISHINLSNWDLNLNERIFLEILTRCPNIQHINLKGCKFVNSFLLALSKQHVNIRSLDFTYCDIFLETFIALARSCPELQSLNLSFNTRVKAGFLHALAKYCNQLKSLDLRGSYLHGDSIVDLSQYCTKLQSLNVSHCTMNDDHILDIVKNCPHLLSLHLRGCYLLTDKALSAIANAYPNLYSIDLVDGNFSNEALIHLVKHCRNLRFISLAGYLIRDQTISTLAEQCVYLQFLDISYCDNITNQAIFSLARHCSYLHTLHLSGSKINHRALFTLVHQCPQLHSIKLRFHRDLIADVHQEEALPNEKRLEDTDAYQKDAKHPAFRQKTVALLISFQEKVHQTLFKIKSLFPLYFYRV